MQTHPLSAAGFLQAPSLPRRSFVRSPAQSLPGAAVSRPEGGCMFGRKREKYFGEADGTPGMDGNAKVRLVAYAHGWNALHRRPGQHNGPLTKSVMDVLEALLWGFCHGKAGRCFPCYKAIAARARVSRATVATAVLALERAGVLTWDHRLRRQGPLVRRTSNAYRFLKPGPLPPAPAQTAKSKNPPARVLSLFSKKREPPIIATDSPLSQALARLGAAILARNGQGIA